MTESLFDQIRRIEDESIKDACARVDAWMYQDGPVPTPPDFRHAFLRERQRLQNLLARIHRDGGHHTEKHGLDQAFADADLRVAEADAHLDAYAAMLRAMDSPSYMPPSRSKRQRMIAEISRASLVQEHDPTE